MGVSVLFNSIIAAARRHLTAVGVSIGTALAGDIGTYVLTHIWSPVQTIVSQKVSEKACEW